MTASKRQRVRLGIIFASFLLLPVILFYFSPYLIVLGAFEGVMAGSMVAFAIQLLSAIFLRRAFCGWTCATGGLQEMEAAVVGKAFAHPKGDLVKWAIWVPWLASIVIGAILAGGIHRVELGYHTEYGLSVASVLGLLIYLGVVAAFFVPNLFLGRRAMCHCICWMAPFMIVGSKLGELLRAPQLHVAAEPDRCIECGRCDRACPMSLPVQSLVVADAVGRQAECIQCAACCDACPKDVLSLRMGRVRR